ncbi:FMN-dependent NADH-azoreductase [Pseudonocardia sp. CA-107938]|uniref:FMN-dependent NADH-azoreductase n=1 Tax=Pseudonocardia sp. CA-107938 TaxID=3240021 RepID=UPI003D8A5AE7
MHLLHLDSSAHPTESVSRRLTALFAGAWRAGHGDATTTYRDLVATPVAPITEAYCTLGRRVESRAATTGPVEDLIRTPDEQREWDLTRALADELVAADVLLLGAPMYNYATPAALKAWIDRISFPGAFTDVDGASLLAGLRVVVVTSCGGAYGPGTDATDRDFLTPYLRAYFTRHGVAPDDIEIVTADRTLAALVPGREHQRPAAARSLAAARARLLALAARL